MVTVVDLAEELRQPVHEEPGGHRQRQGGPRAQADEAAQTGEGERRAEAVAPHGRPRREPEDRLAAKGYVPKNIGQDQIVGGPWGVKEQREADDDAKDRQVQWRGLGVKEIGNELEKLARGDLLPRVSCQNPARRESAGVWRNTPPPASPSSIASTTNSSGNGSARRCWCGRRCRRRRALPPQLRGHRVARHCQQVLAGCTSRAFRRFDPCIPG